MPRWLRLGLPLAGFLLVVTACDSSGTGDTAASTTAAPTTAAPTTTTTTLAPAGPPIASVGDRNQAVAAFQFLLNCSGFGPLDVDGVFGPASQSAIEAAQEALDREVTGAGDDGLLAQLSRDCSDARRVTMSGNNGSAVGNVAPTDPDTFFVRSGGNERLTAVVVSEGGVARVDLRAADGSSLDVGSAAVAAVVAGNLDYALQVSTIGDEPITYTLYVGTHQAPAGAIGAAQAGTVEIGNFIETVSSVCLDTTGEASFVAETPSGYLVVVDGALGTFGPDVGGIGAMVEFIYRDGSPGYHGFTIDLDMDMGIRIVGTAPVFLAAAGAAGQPQELAFNFPRSAIPCEGGEATPILLTATGIGVVEFGADDGSTVALAREALAGSSPIVDTGWVALESTVSDYGVCRVGTTEIRVVQIDNLILYFTDAITTWKPEGGRHLAAYRASEGPYPFKTRFDVGPGSSVVDFLNAHVDAVLAESRDGGVDVFVSSPPTTDEWLRANAAGAAGKGDTAATITDVFGGRFCDL